MSCMPTQRISLVSLTIESLLTNVANYAALNHGDVYPGAAVVLHLQSRSVLNQASDESARITMFVHPLCKPVRSRFQNGVGDGVVMPDSTVELYLRREEAVQNILRDGE